MSILGHIVAISLILLSVVKTADLFIHSDRALAKVQKQFVYKTQKLHQNDRGNISIMAAVLVTIISSLLLFYLTKMKLEFKEALYRKDSYLCLRFLNSETAHYIKEMAVFNSTLRAAFAARQTVVNGVQGEVLFRALVASRNIRHFIYLKKLTGNKYCLFPESLSYLKNPPFQLKGTGALQTNIDETTLVRKNRWSTLVYKIPNGIRLKKSFCLKSDFSIKGAFIPGLKIKTREIEATSPLKCLSGSSS